MVDFILSFMHFETEIEELIFMNKVSMGLALFSLSLGVINLIFIGFRFYKIYKDEENHEMYSQDEDIGDC